LEKGVDVFKEVPRIALRVLVKSTAMKILDGKLVGVGKLMSLLSTAGQMRDKLFVPHSQFPRFSFLYS